MAGIVFYKDLPLDFTPNPVTGDVRPITNEVAIKRAIKNLILTQKGSKPFLPDYGTNLKKYLFRNLNPFEIIDLEREIATSIQRNESRVTLRKVEALKDDENGVKVTVEYVIKNMNVASSVTTTLQRV
jgi:phage baseplate assembly protein W